MAFSILLPLCLAPLLTIPIDGQSVRFGIAGAAEVLADGLSLAGGGTLQWRRLPIGSRAIGSRAIGSKAIGSKAGTPDDQVWIELAIVAPRVGRNAEARPSGSGDRVQPVGALSLGVALDVVSTACQSRHGRSMCRRGPDHLAG